MHTVLKGNLFEERVTNLITKSINDGQFGVIPQYCKVFKKPKYHSKERESNITFDISIEVWPPNSERYHLLYLVECKDYTNHSVPVDDIEEFVSKIDQVAGKNVKGVFVITGKLQSAALTYAKNKGLMIIHVSADDTPTVLLHNKKRLYDSPVHSQESESWSYQINKLNEIENMVNEDFASVDWDHELERFISRELNYGIQFPDQEPYLIGIQRLSKKLIEKITSDIINEFDPGILAFGKSFPMESFCIYLKDQYGLEIIFDDNISKVKGLNAYCNAKEKKIFIDTSLKDSGQYLFVCAHEIAHFLLHPNLRLLQEAYDNMEDSKYNPAIGKFELINEKHWLEWQANQFAAALILPQQCVLLKLIMWQKKEGISKVGRVWLDDQPCNRRDFKVMLTQLAFEFRVSREILQYRMSDLGIIQYAKGTNKYPYGTFGRVKEPELIGQIITKYVSSK